jgi:hypothetical protein
MDQPWWVRSTWYGAYQNGGGGGVEAGGERDKGTGTADISVD